MNQPAPEPTHQAQGWYAGPWTSLHTHYARQREEQGFHGPCRDPEVYIRIAAMLRAARERQA